MANRIKLTSEKKDRFCEVLAATGANVTRAAEAIGVSRRYLYEVREDDKEFAAAWDAAVALGIEAIEDEITRRAVEGVDKPLTHQGNFTYLRDFEAIDPETGKHFPPHLAPVLKDAQGRPVVATVKEYSDTLLIFKAKAMKPEKYRDRADINVTGKITLEDLIVGSAEGDSK